MSAVSSIINYTIEINGKDLKEKKENLEHHLKAIQFPKPGSSKTAPLTLKIQNWKFSFEDIVALSEFLQKEQCIITLQCIDCLYGKDNYIPEQILPKLWLGLIKSHIKQLNITDQTTPTIALSLLAEQMTKSPNPTITSFICGNREPQGSEALCNAVLACTSITEFTLPFLNLDPTNPNMKRRHKEVQELYQKVQAKLLERTHEELKQTLRAKGGLSLLTLYTQHIEKTQDQAQGQGQTQDQGQRDEQTQSQSQAQTQASEHKGSTAGSSSSSSNSSSSSTTSSGNTSSAVTSASVSAMTSTTASTSSSNATSRKS